MNFDDTSPKEFEELLVLTKKRKEKIRAEYNAAQDKFLTAMGGNSTLETRQALGDQADALKAELDKTIAGIKWLENRLGGNVTESPIVDKVQQTADTVKAPATDSVAESSRHFQKNAGKILNLLKVQITPSSICVDPNDSTIKSLFHTSGDTISVTEKHKSKNKPAVTYNLTVQGAALYNPLSEYDRAVLGVLIGEYDIGNRYTTVNIIHRALIGKPGKAHAGFFPHKDQETAIINSISKLMGTVVDFSDAVDSWKKLKYVDKEGNELILRKDNLLSASIFDAKVNGQPVEGVIFFKENLSLFKIASAKDQVVRYPHELLNVPNQHNTPLVISLKHYVLRRVCEIKAHKQLKPTITFDDVFSKCKVEGANIAKKRQDARNVIFRFLEHLKAQNFISDFEVKKDGREYSKISFLFEPQDTGH